MSVTRAVNLIAASPTAAGELEGRGAENGLEKLAGRGAVMNSAAVFSKGHMSSDTNRNT